MTTKTILSKASYVVRLLITIAVIAAFLLVIRELQKGTPDDPNFYSTQHK